MEARRTLKGFYFITDSRLTVNGVAEDVRRALRAGAALIQYREKGKTEEERLREAEEILRLCRNRGAPFIINDYVDLAREINADGVHLGQEDTPIEQARAALGPSAIIGISADNLEEALDAEKRGADYVALGPVFPTGTKKDAGKPVGVEALKEVKKRVKVPLAAIGGITRENARLVWEAGADLVCAISASLERGRVEENIKALLEGCPWREKA